MHYNEVFKDKSVHKKKRNEIYVKKGIEMSGVLSNCANKMNKMRSGRGLFWILTEMDVKFLTKVADGCKWTELVQW